MNTMQCNIFSMGLAPNFLLALLVVATFHSCNANLMDSAVCKTRLASLQFFAVCLIAETFYCTTGIFWKLGR
jgi:hypothetical protein